MFDHGILSPSGRVSKRSRKAALERARKEIFGPLGLVREDYTRQPTETESLLKRAQELRKWAALGLKPRAHLREAIRLEAKARGE